MHCLLQLPCCVPDFTRCTPGGQPLWPSATYKAPRGGHPDSKPGRGVCRFFVHNFGQGNCFDPPLACLSTSCASRLTGLPLPRIAKRPQHDTFCKFCRNQLRLMQRTEKSPGGASAARVQADTPCACASELLGRTLEDPMRMS